MFRPLLCVFVLSLSAGLARAYEDGRETLEQRIAEHNQRYEQGLETYKLGFNDLSMLSSSEIRKRYMGYSKTANHFEEKKFAIRASVGDNGEPVVVNGIELNTPVDELPAAVDWRQATKHVTPIKNQAMCGSCWAYASTAVLEFYVNQVSNRSMTLSTEQITKCSPNLQNCGGTGACAGGTPGVAYDYVIESHGVTDSDVMPYVDGTNITCVDDDPSPEKFTCQESRTGVFAGKESTRMFATLTNYTILPTNDYVTMMNAVAKIGPIAISIDAGSYADPNNPNADTFKSYSSGVFTGCDWKYGQNKTDLNHLMVLEGYGDDPEGGKYWLIRNSWKSNWGEGGYMRLARSDNDGDKCDWDNTPEDGFSCTGPTGNIDVPPIKVCGPCGMLSQGVIPTGVGYENGNNSSSLYYDPEAAPASTDPSTGSCDDDDDDDNETLYFNLMITFAVLFAVSASTMVIMWLSGGKKYGVDSGSSLRNPLHS